MSKFLVSDNGYTHNGWLSDEMTFVGAIMGDIIGSAYERKGCRIKTINFDLFPKEASFTDDTVMTIAIAKWLSGYNSIPKNSHGLTYTMQAIGRKYMGVGYGHNFKQWLKSDNPQPYNSYGNGSAMRVAAAGLFGLNLLDCQAIARITAGVSHNHPEGIKGAEAVASAIRLAKFHRSKECIKEYIEKKYGYNLSRNLNDIREIYEFDSSCQGSVPEAIICFLESEDMESAIRLAVSLGGDADTQACIAGSISGAFYGSAPEIFLEKLEHMLPPEFIDIISVFITKNNRLDKTICEKRQIDHSDLNKVLQERYPIVFSS